LADGQVEEKFGMRVSRYLGRVASVTAAAVLAGTSFASAADLGGSYKDPVYAPPVVESDIWTGFYVGGQGGIGAGKASGRTGIEILEGDPEEWTLLGNRFSDSTNLAGGVAGIYGGYNWQIGQTVLGIEGDYTWSDVEGTTYCVGGGARCKVDLDWTASLVARAGYAVGRGLWYVKGGAAWGRVATQVDSNTLVGLALAGDFDAVGRAKRSKTSLGWTVGMGYEHAFTKNFIVRVDYSYMDFGSETYKFSGESLVGDEYVGARGRSNIDTTVNQIKVGAAIKF
jgi:outer membrane immunogenic protein